MEVIDNRALDVNFTKGKCFICGKACLPEAYGHYECAIAYSEYKLQQKRAVMLKKGLI